MKAEYTNTPAPTGGMNTRDDYAAMPLNDAISLINLVPENGYVRSRGGSKLFYDIESRETEGGQIDTLAVFDDGLNNLLISCSAGRIYNMTDPLVPIELKTGQTSDYYDTMMFNKKLIMCNGVDTPQVFEGLLETIDLVATLESGKNTIADKTIADIIGCNQYKGRAFYWIDKEQRFFYADVAGAYQGVLKEFDLSQQVRKGGKIVSIFTYARDTGSGLDDYLAIMFNTGECLLYQGDDPGSVNNWSLVQRHNIGMLVNNRSVCQKGGDNLLITSEGIVNFSLAIQGLSAQNENQTGSKIVNSISANFKAHQYNNGWEINYLPEFNFIIANVPRRPEYNEYKQFVLNTSTGAWCKFRDLNATTWIVYNGMLLYGDAVGNIIQAETGTHDREKYIKCRAVSAFSHFNQMGRWKKCTGIGITCNIPYKEHIKLKVLKDYDKSPPIILATPDDPLPVEELGSIWNQGIWNVDKWDDVTADAFEEWNVGQWNVGQGFANKTEKKPKKYTTELDQTRTLFYPSSGKGYVLATKLKILTRTTEFQWYNLLMRLKVGGRK